MKLNINKATFLLSFIVVFVLVSNVKSQVMQEADVKGINQEKLLKPEERSNKIEVIKSDFERKYNYSKNSSDKNYNFHFQNILANPTDSAYVYNWVSNDWQLDTRILYYIGSSNIEIVEESKVPGSGEWEKESKTELLYYETNGLQRETNSFWKNTTKEWVVEGLEEFNERGLTTEYYSKIWNDTTQKFIAGVRIASTYENDTNLVEDLLQVWDTVVNTWNNVLMIENNFSSNGFITKSTEKIYSDKKSDWENSYVIDYQHNEIGELLNEKSQYWDTISNSWKNDVQIIRDYNELSRLTSQLVQVWDTVASEWENNNKRTVGYNDFLQVEEISDQMWDAETESWMDTTRAVYNYNSLGDISKYYEEAWNGENWENVYQELYVYDVQSNLTDITIEEWDIENQKWENSTIIYYTYAIEGYTKSRQDDYWNTNTNSWETGFYAELDVIANALDFIEYYDKMWNDSLNKFTEGFRELSTYYSNGQSKEIIVQEWDTTTSSWVNDQKIYYYWNAALPVDQVSLEQVSIYPIPFKDNLNFELKDAQNNLEIEIYNIQGQKMETLVLVKKVNTIDLSRLKNGVYFIVYETDSKKQVRKIVKH